MAAPLADRMRPTTLDEIVGQDRWLATDAPLRRSIEAGDPYSIVLWGPPGCGKTTLARVIANHTGMHFVQLSAVLDGVKELRGVIERAHARQKSSESSLFGSDVEPDSGGTLLFVDEIHRWNKAQQDALLPHLEAGTVVLIGATTENPSFHLNAALRSRVQIVQLDPLDDDQILGLLQRAWTQEWSNHEIDPDVLPSLARLAAGDARQALSDLERAMSTLGSDAVLTTDHVTAVLQRNDLRHDDEDHFNVVSALIKSMRGSDPDASLYWLARLIAAGEDPVYIARRLVVFASEDVGNADPRALQVAMSATEAVRLLGFPEGRIPLAQAVTWLACAPKSNAAYVGVDAALQEVRRSGALPVPLHLRNAPTQEMKDAGYGDGYRYPHDHPFRIVSQQYLPDALQGARYYAPADHGEERTIRERLAWWARKLDES